MSCTDKHCSRTLMADSAAVPYLAQKLGAFVMHSLHHWLPGFYVAFRKDTWSPAEASKSSCPKMASWMC